MWADPPWTSNSSIGCFIGRSPVRKEIVSHYSVLLTSPRFIALPPLASRIVSHQMGEEGGSISVPGYARE